VQRTQLLFQVFRQRNAKRHEREGEGLSLEEFFQIEWHKLVHECLYGDKVTKTVERIKEQDKYIGQFLDIIEESPVTINYNFDDTIQRLLYDRTRSRSLERSYVTVWASNVQLPERKGVIYHPNGFLPYELSQQPSEHLVFLQEAFADQLIESAQGRYATLTNHLARSTCLLIGLSLDDPTLRHILRHSAQIYPGHIHYRVVQIQDHEVPDQEHRLAEFEANFRVYNLITMHLSHAEMSALGWLLAMKPDDFSKFAAENKVRSTHRFFIAGPVGVGKTTCLRNFQSYRIHEEWPDPLLEEMTVAPNELTDDALRRIDRWVDGEINKKNTVILSQDEGIDFVDRAPLDAMAFVPRDQWDHRATELLNAISGNDDPHRNLGDGHLILLVGDAKQVDARARRVFRKPTVKGIEHQEAVLREVYSPNHPGVTVIDTRGLTPADVARRVLNIMYREYPDREYATFPFHEKLLQLCAQS
jgi:SIR2-like domain